MVFAKYLLNVVQRNKCLLLYSLLKLDLVNFVDKFFFLYINIPLFIGNVQIQFTF